MKVEERLSRAYDEKGAALLVLIDPDKIELQKINKFINTCVESGVDGFLIGGSLMIAGDLNECLKTIKEASNLPLIIFPGSLNQVSPLADAILFLSLISGRNPEHLIGKHVIAAPLIKKYNIEAISTGYILIDSGAPTTASYISGSQPIPRNKPEIAAATALAAQYLGMKMIYLEAGSGAKLSIPKETIRAVSNYCDIPLIVGGGVKDPETAREKVEAGAKIIVVGNHFEDPKNWGQIKEFASAVHFKFPVEA